jgi:large repetitive protein
VTIAGIASSIALAINPNVVTAGAPNSSISTTVNALDADGNVIVGPYVDVNGNPVTVTLSDPDTTGATSFSQTTFSQSSSNIVLSYSGGHPTSSIAFTATAPGLNTASATLSILPGHMTFAFTGGDQAFTIPQGITQVAITALGAQGGEAFSATFIGPAGSATPLSSGVGGNGASITGTFAVTPGQSIDVFVGGQGGQGQENGGGAAGYDGGGAGGGTVGGGGGGGASDVRFSGKTLANRVIVAGGGGGGGMNFYQAEATVQSPFNGGVGGGPDGGDAVSDFLTHTMQGLGASQTSGGKAGRFIDNGIDGCPNGTWGTLGAGGNGSICEVQAYTTGGGGGGGGWYGGGGGATMPGGSYAGPWAAGGGGGSSYAIAAASSVTYAAGINSGNGQVTITW